VTDYHALRPATVTDISFIVELETAPENGFVHQNTYEEHLDALSQDENTIYWIAEDKSGNRLGYAFLYRSSPQRMEFRRVVISSKEKGTGSKFITAVCKTMFEDANLETIWLDVYQSNDQARYVYSKLGFREIKIDEDKPHPKFGPLIIMELERKSFG
jgi:RimJ/RimL family protein N-acetyltransferase